VVDHVTPTLLEPVTVAVNCWLPPWLTTALVGEIATETVPEGVTVTEAEAEELVFAWLVAVTVTLVAEVTVGAVKSPVPEMVPAVADQVTEVFLEPVTVALNCWVPPELSVTVVGEMVTETVGGVTVTVAEAEELGLAWLVAVTVTVVVEVTLGAVKRPEVEIEPAVADQVTAVLVEPVTVAVNCWLAPELAVTVVGEIETETVPAGVTVTVAEAEALELAWLVAFTVTLVVEVTVGAVKSPLLEMLPAVADQVTALLKVPVTVALNCWVPSELMVALVGEIDTDTAPNAFATAHKIASARKNHVRRDFLLCRGEFSMGSMNPSLAMDRAPKGPMPLRCNCIEAPVDPDFPPSFGTIGSAQALAIPQSP
jgi:hypothetical protein